MPEHHIEHSHNIHKLKKHRNVLYLLLVLLVIIQTISFVVLSSQVSKLDNGLDNTRKDFTKALQENNDYYQELIQQMNLQNKNSLTDLSKKVTTQQANFEQEISGFQQQISLIKSSHEDFSGIITEVVKGVVSIGTDKAAGSGFILDKAGYIVTNDHVISGAKEIRILTTEGKSYPAKLIGSDSFYDVALLKVEGNFNILELEDSQSVQVGKKVITIGNPYGLSFSVTEGIISALKRTGPNGKAEYIQTDVSLNPGNSGGPLIDTQGKVVGINNFKVGSAENLGFALESSSLKKVVNRLANTTLIS